MRVFLFLLFVTATIHSQTVLFKGKIIDEESKEPVVYANLSFFKTTKGISSLEDGSFSLEIEKKLLEYKIHVSCLNYMDTIVYARDLHNSVFKLKPKTELLEEVILDKLEERKVVLDPIKKRKVKIGFVTNDLRMIAKYFPKIKKGKGCDYVEKITIWFPKSRANKKAKFRLRIMSKNLITGKPEMDLLTKSIPITIKKEDRNYQLDLSNFYIKIPQNGFFIVFEKLHIPFNEYYITASKKKGKNDRKKKKEFSHLELYYAPVIGIFRTDYFKKGSKIFVFKSGNWKELSWMSKERESLAISVTLTD